MALGLSIEIRASDNLKHNALGRSHVLVGFPTSYSKMAAEVAPSTVSDTLSSIFGHSDAPYVQNLRFMRSKISKAWKIFFPAYENFRAMDPQLWEDIDADDDLYDSVEDWDTKMFCICEANRTFVETAVGVLDPHNQFDGRL